MGRLRGVYDNNYGSKGVGSLGVGSLGCGSLGTGSIGSAVCATYGEIITEAAPVGYWKLDETSGTTINAEIGTSGNMYGNYIRGTDPLVVNDTVDAKSVNISANAGYGLMPNPLSAGESSFTVELWVSNLVHRLQGAVIASVNGTVGSPSWVIGFGQTTPTELYIYSGGGTSTVYPDITLVDGERHHIVVVWNETPANTVKTYIDGELYHTYNTSVFNIGQFPSIMFGAYSQYSCFTGFYDNIAIYDYSITIEQIQDHYNIGK